MGHKRSKYGQAAKAVLLLKEKEVKDVDYLPIDFDNDEKGWDKLDLDFNIHTARENGRRLRGRIAICTCEDMGDTCSRSQRKRKADTDEFILTSDFKCDQSNFFHPCFHSRDVKKPYNHSTYDANIVLLLVDDGNFICPTPIARPPKNELWEVERILLTKREVNYPDLRLVLWKNFGFNETTWEYPENLLHCAAVKSEFGELEKELKMLATQIGRKNIDLYYPGYIEMYELAHLTPGGLYAKIAQTHYNKEYARKRGPYRKQIIVENWTTELAELNVNFITTSLYTKKARKALKEAEKHVDQFKRCLHLTRAAYKHSTNEALVAKVPLAIQTPEGRCCPCEEDCKEETCPCLCKFYKEAFVRVTSQNHFTECHKSCPCKASKRLMAGTKYRFILFYTYNAGWSVRALQSIPQDHYVMEYIGTVCLATETKTSQDDSYLFDCQPPPAAYYTYAELSNTGVDYTHSPKYVIDATKHGDISRFINHSCDPNLYACTVQGREHDLAFLRVVFFSRRTINYGEELTFNYFDSPIDLSVATIASPKCHCGAKKCRGYLITTSGKEAEVPVSDEKVGKDSVVFDLTKKTV